MQTSAFTTPTRSWTASCGSCFSWAVEKRTFQKHSGRVFGVTGRMKNNVPSQRLFCWLPTWKGWASSATTSGMTCRILSQGFSMIARPTSAVYVSESQWWSSIASRVACFTVVKIVEKKCKDHAHCAVAIKRAPSVDGAVPPRCSVVQINILNWEGWRKGMVEGFHVSSLRNSFAESSRLLPGRNSWAGSVSGRD